MTINKVNSVNLTNYYKVNAINNVRGINKVEKDKIEISETGKMLNNYGMDIKDIDKSKRVEELRELIKNGEYKVDSRKLAESMIDNIKGKRF